MRRQETWPEVPKNVEPVKVQRLQTRVFKLDNFGRLMEETHPENGVTSYMYDDAGNAVQKLDARGIYTNTGYDDLNRPLQIQYSDTTPYASFVYDLGVNGVGRLYEAINANAISRFDYDPMGRVAKHEKTILGVTFNSEFGYNHAGQQASMKLPNGKTIFRDYDAIGRLAQIRSDWIDSRHPEILADNFVYHASGAVLSFDYGNGTTSQRSFHSGLQLKSIAHGTSSNPSAFPDLECHYDEGIANSGRIMQMSDHNDPSRSVSFDYDEFGRLTAAETAGSHWGLAWNYDPYGNQLSQSLTKGTGPTRSVSVDANTNRINGFSYDAAGNMLSDGTKSYA